MVIDVEKKKRRLIKLWITKINFDRSCYIIIIFHSFGALLKRNENLFPSLAVERLFANFHPHLIIYGVINVVIIVIVPIIGNKNELAPPMSVPPLATTSASSPPEEDNPKPALNAVRVL